MQYIPQLFNKLNDYALTHTHRQIDRQTCKWILFCWIFFCCCWIFDDINFIMGISSIKHINSSLLSVREKEWEKLSWKWNIRFNWMQIKWTVICDWHLYFNMTQFDFNGFTNLLAFFFFGRMETIWSSLKLIAGY